ncbi:MAG: uroporphyrinogen decarboxylase, partial [Bdellovibrio sp.]
SPALFEERVTPTLVELARKFPGKLAYYGKGTQPDFLNAGLRGAPFAGFGFDHRWNLPALFSRQDLPGFIQGNFDQALLFCDEREFRLQLENYLRTFKQTSEVLSRWVCGLGHGVLPKTPESHVHYFVQRVREVFQ